MKDFTIKVNVTTIAMKMTFSHYDYDTDQTTETTEWVVDTYTRINPKKNFIENFMNEYSGNGIEQVKIIDEWENEYPVETLGCFSTIENHIKSQFDKINETVLNY